MKFRKFKKKGTVYVLKLEHGCWYVGFTNYFNQRIFAHFNGFGSAWTKLHPPIEVAYFEHDVSPRKEAEFTIKAMKKYGVDKVRGGEWIGTTEKAYCPPKYLARMKRRKKAA